MQDFFFLGIISAIALGVVLIKSIFFVIHLINVKHSNEIIARNLANVRLANIQTQQVQGTTNSIDSVTNWKVEDPRLTEDFRQQFLTKTKTKTRRTPTSGQASPRERVPLATTDFGEPFDEVSEESVPIYTYNASLGGTQV